jgi:hypothetical protein
MSAAFRKPRHLDRSEAKRRNLLHGAGILQSAEMEPMKQKQEAEPMTQGGEPMTQRSGAYDLD